MDNSILTSKKNKFSFIILSIKKTIIPFSFFIFTICLILFSKSNLYAAKSGLELFINKLIPSLLPFFIATELLSYTDIIYKIGRLFNPIMKPLFHIPRYW